MSESLRRKLKVLGSILGEPGLEARGREKREDRSPIRASDFCDPGNIRICNAYQTCIPLQ